jgi:hypothetical protein
MDIAVPSLGADEWMVGTGLGAVTARQDCDEARPVRVGQASDQASDSVGQAGAGDHDDKSKPKARRLDGQ